MFAITSTTTKPELIDYCQLCHEFGITVVRISRHAYTGLKNAAGITFTGKYMGILFIETK